jgi:uncharacterized protein YacL
MNPPIRPKRSWETLKADDLDAIATFAGWLSVVTNQLEKTLVMPMFSAELERIADKAFDELKRRGQREKEGMRSCNTNL